MQLEGIKRVSGCTDQVSLLYGGAIHSLVIKSGLFSNVGLGNSMISMYCKCGCLAESKLIFAELPARDSVSWNALIAGHRIDGCGNEAIQVFNDVQKYNINADLMTLLAALTACNHSGLIEEAQELFHEAIREKNPLGIEHYAGLVDLLGRAGRIEAASELVRWMPFRPTVKIWSSLVSACMDHGRLEVAEQLAHKRINLEPDNAAYYKLLSIIYAKSNDWHSVVALQRCMREKGQKNSSKIKV